MRPLTGFPEPRPEILQAPQAVHGRCLDLEELHRLGLHPEDVAARL